MISRRPRCWCRGPHRCVRPPAACAVLSGLATGALAACALAACALAACGGGSDSPTAPNGPSGAASQVVLALTLPRIDTTREGRYEAWVVDGAGAHHSLGRF